MRDFLIWPDKRLSAVADEVTAVDDAVRAIWDEMVLLMEAMPGVGLAAPQIGVGLRLAVVDASAERGQVRRLANPVLIASEGPLVAGQEGSPNLPGIVGQVKRPEKVTVGYLDETGAAREERFVGLWARSVQHQIDHLDGLLYVDRLSRVKRDVLLRKFRKGR